jgi:DNA-binding PadR family transcriptional regulator
MHRTDASMHHLMLDLAILGLLRERDRHGYELRKQLAELLGARGAMSFGSLYPALARLEKQGLVKAVEANTRTDRPVPSSGSLAGELAAFRARRTATAPGGRSRKVYGITEAGEARLLECLAEPGVDDRTFAVQVAFCRHLPPAGRLALFEGRRAALAARLEETRPAGPLDRYLRSLRDRDAHAITHDLAWLDELIATERSAIDVAAKASLQEETNP